MYFVNWQREISLEEKDGRKVIVKRNKSYKEFHEYILASTYTLISILVGHPCRPPPFGKTLIENESHTARERLSRIGILTPRLLFFSDDVIIEEYIECGNLYKVLLATKQISKLSFQAGAITGKMHKSGYVFIDNKSQNYLVSQDNIYRTDIGFMQKNTSIFSQSMDIASFLASIIDLKKDRYSQIEESFFEGYRSVTDRGFPYLSIALRNILALGLASNRRHMVTNMYYSNIQNYIYI